jgi:hypothetical protein
LQGVELDQPPIGAHAHVTPWLRDARRGSEAVIPKARHASYAPGCRHFRVLLVATYFRHFPGATGLFRKTKLQQHAVSEPPSTNQPRHSRHVQRVSTTSARSLLSSIYRKGRAISLSVVPRQGPPLPVSRAPARDRIMWPSDPSVRSRPRFREFPTILREKRLIEVAPNENEKGSTEQ